MEWSKACRIAEARSSAWAVFTTYASAPAASAASTCCESAGAGRTITFSSGARSRASARHSLPSTVSPSISRPVTNRLGRRSSIRARAWPGEVAFPSTSIPRRWSTCSTASSQSGCWSSSTAVRGISERLIERAAFRLDYTKGSDNTSSLVVCIGRVQHVREGFTRRSPQLWKSRGPRRPLDGLVVPRRLLGALERRQHEGRRVEVLGGAALALDVLVDALDDLGLEARRLGRRRGRQPLVARIETEVELVERD